MAFTIALPDNPTEQYLKDTYREKGLRELAGQLGIVPTGMSEDELAKEIAQKLSTKTANTTTTTTTVGVLNQTTVQDMLNRLTTISNQVQGLRTEVNVMDQTVAQKLTNFEQELNARSSSTQQQGVTTMAGHNSGHNGHNSHAGSNGNMATSTVVKWIGGLFVALLLIAFLCIVIAFAPLGIDWLEARIAGTRTAVAQGVDTTDPAPDPKPTEVVIPNPEPTRGIAAAAPSLEDDNHQNQIGYTIPPGNGWIAPENWTCSGDLDIFDGNGVWISYYLWENDQENTGMISQFNGKTRVFAPNGAYCDPDDSIDTMKIRMAQNGCTNGCKEFNIVYWP